MLARSPNRSMSLFLQADTSEVIVLIYSKVNPRALSQQSILWLIKTLRLEEVLVCLLSQGHRLRTASIHQLVFFQSHIVLVGDHDGVSLNEGDRYESQDEAEDEVNQADQLELDVLGHESVAKSISRFSKAGIHVATSKHLFDRLISTSSISFFF